LRVLFSAWRILLPKGRASMYGKERNKKGRWTKRWQVTNRSPTMKRRKRAKVQSKARAMVKQTRDAGQDNFPYSRKKAYPQISEKLVGKVYLL